MKGGVGSTNCSRSTGEGALEESRLRFVFTTSVSKLPTETRAPSVEFPFTCDGCAVLAATRYVDHCCISGQQNFIRHILVLGAAVVSPESAALAVSPHKQLATINDCSSKARTIAHAATAGQDALIDDFGDHLTAAKREHR